MAYRNPAQQGNRRPFDARVKISALQQLKGVSLDSDPGAVSPDHFQNLENIRFQEGILVPRGGQTKLFGTPLSGAVDGIWEAGDVGAGEAQEAVPVEAGALYLLGANHAIVGNAFSSYDPVSGLVLLLGWDY